MLIEGNNQQISQEDVLKVPGKAMLHRVNVYCLCCLPYTKDSMITCAKVFHAFPSHLRA